MNLINTYNRSRTVAFMTKVDLTNEQKQMVERHIRTTNKFINFISDAYTKLPVKSLREVSNLFLYNEKLKIGNDEQSDLIEILAESAKQKRTNYDFHQLLDNNRAFRYIRVPYIGGCEVTIDGLDLHTPTYGKIKLHQSPNIAKQNGLATLGIMDVAYYDIGIYRDPNLRGSDSEVYFVIIHLPFADERRTGRGLKQGIIIHPHEEVANAIDFHVYDRTTGEIINENITYYEPEVFELYDRCVRIAEDIEISSPAHVTTRKIVRSLGSRYSSISWLDFLIAHIQLKYYLSYSLRTVINQIKASSVVLVRPYLVRYDALMLDRLYGYGEQEQDLWVLFSQLITESLPPRTIDQVVLEITDRNIRNLNLGDVDVLYRTDQINQAIYENYTHLISSRRK